MNISPREMEKGTRRGAARAPDATLYSFGNIPQMRALQLLSSLQELL